MPRKDTERKNVFREHKIFEIVYQSELKYYYEPPAVPYLILKISYSFFLKRHFLSYVKNVIDTVDEGVSGDKRTELRV